MTLVLLGLLIFLIGVSPDLIGMDRSPVVGFVQVGVWLSGLALLLLGAYLTIRVVRNGRLHTLLAEVGVRLPSPPGTWWPRPSRKSCRDSSPRSRRMFAAEEIAAQLKRIERERNERDAAIQDEDDPLPKSPIRKAERAQRFAMIKELLTAGSSWHVVIDASSRTLLDKISAPDDFRRRYLRRSESRRRTVRDVHGRYPMFRHGPTGVCRIHGATRRQD